MYIPIQYSIGSVHCLYPFAQVRSRHSPLKGNKPHISCMFSMLRTWQCLCQHISGLIWITATRDRNDPIFHKFAHPVPASSDMFGALVELWVLRHSNRSLVITPDLCWQIFLKQSQLIIYVSEPECLSQSLGKHDVFHFC